MNTDVTKQAVLILDDEAKHAIDVHGILLQEGFVEIFTFHDNQAAERWLARHTPDIAIGDPRLRDGSCRGVVSTLTKRGVPYIVYSEMRPGSGSWLADGQWIAKPCIPHLMLSAVRFAIAMRQVQTIASSMSVGKPEHAGPISPIR